MLNQLVLHELISSLNQQIKLIDEIIDEQQYEVAQNLPSKWQDQSADQFTDTVYQNVQGARDFIAYLHLYVSNLQKAEEIIVEADLRASALVKSLSDLYK